MSRLDVALAVACAAPFLASAGCGDLFHSTDWNHSCGEDSEDPACTSGATGAGTGGTTAASSGADAPCTPGDKRDCYTGPAGTENHGTCKPGTQTCSQDGTGFGPCEGEVVPVTEDCGAPGDEDCDGEVDEGCVNSSCKAHKAADPMTPSGVRSIDPDGPGPLAPTLTYCDMETDGGGWTLLAKTVKTGLTPAEKATIRESLWATYAQTGYGDPSPPSKLYWLPLVYWNALTVLDPTNELVSRTSAGEVLVVNVAVAGEAGKFKWTWAAGPKGSPEIAGYLNGMNFTARDNDNDDWGGGNCAVESIGLSGGFWYKDLGGAGSVPGHCDAISMLHPTDVVYTLDGNYAEVEQNEIYVR